MSGQFILSLDCEGRWGVADHLTEQHRATLTDERLRWAYRSIIELLDKYEVPATFAFVGGFTWDRDTIDLPRLRDFSRLAPEYINPILAEIEVSEGWLGGWAADMIDEPHELALHGAAHVPWGSVDQSVARAELALLETMPRVSGAKTYVYPRNQVNHTALLASAGIQSWREARRKGRLRSLLSEFDVRTPADCDGVSIPAGYFVNWRSGARRLVPIAVSRRRARNMLADAAAHGRTAHYWTHPENIASAPETLQVLEAILMEVSTFMKRGLINPVTQLKYWQARNAD